MTDIDDRLFELIRKMATDASDFEELHLLWRELYPGDSVYCADHDCKHWNGWHPGEHEAK